MACGPGGRGADCVLELVGAATWSQSIQAAGSRGRVVVIGSHSGLNVQLNLGAVFSKNLSIEGITRANRSSMEEVVRRAEAGKLNPSIGHIVLLEQVSEAHRLMDTNAHTGKIVLSVDYIYLLFSAVSDSCFAAAIITPKHMQAETKVIRTSIPGESAHVK